MYGFIKMEYLHYITHPMYYIFADKTITWIFIRRYNTIENILCFNWARQNLGNCLFKIIKLILFNSIWSSFPITIFQKKNSFFDETELLLKRRFPTSTYNFLNFLSIFLFLFLFFSTVKYYFIINNHHTKMQGGLQHDQFVSLFSQIEGYYTNFKLAQLYAESDKFICRIHSSELPHDNDLNLVMIHNPTMDRDLLQLHTYTASPTKTSLFIQLRIWPAPDFMSGKVGSRFSRMVNQVHRDRNGTFSRKLFVLIWVWV